MDMFSHLMSGFSQALSLETLGFAFIGVLIGTLTGILPGIGPITAIALLIPMSYGMEPMSGLIMLIGIYYGSMYGGSTTAILVKTPGEVASIVTTLDGYEMAKQGKAGRALSAAAIGSFIAGTLSTLGLMLLAPVLAKAAFFFGSAEYFLMIVLAMSMVSSLTTGSALKAYISTLFGLSIAMVGIDLQSSVPRYSFGIPNLLDGIDFVLVAIALFAIPEALSTMARKGKVAKMNVQNFKGSNWMTREDWKRSVGPFGRGSLLGFIIGVLPGLGPSLASFLSYGMEKKLSKRPEEFGKGAIEGVSGPEAANNAGVGGALVPLFTLGIPGSATTALLMFIFMMYGMQPGPGMFNQHPELIWAIIASMYIGNVMLLILNLPLVGVFASLLKLPTVPLFVGVVAFSVLGVYGINYNQFDLMLLFGFGLIGYAMQRFDFPLAPAVMALVLGPLLEQNFRRSLDIANWFTFFERPISLVLSLIIIAIIIVPIVNMVFKKKRNNNKPLETEIRTNA
ncbi:tripartite tricarboxylate transporter permease [Fictibacillus terranigra]|uniref:Tripartite tricarboxylate transporter permease n=1 Tax=Fictibacillus terranigra TaxID=3058424 RepID=A0ABT8EC65_9BACL|nr:tripartite tricarboxylate transporter permease [Fictibacillus sp. CENA-BCM004]MDN4075486.1 tripartite tricarboxylate transporter permease [Fictibacillus sp. CENA-BCM004]